MRLSTSTIFLSKNGFLNNIKFLKSFSPDSKFFPVVKANAYGHGLEEVVSIIDDYVDGYCVHSIDEGICVDSRKPVLILGHTGDSRDVLIDALKQREFYFTIYSFSQAEILKEVGKTTEKKIGVFIKVETGTNRLGLPEGDALKLADFVDRTDFLELKGFSTHFANIEDTTDHSFAYKQIEVFESLIKKYGKNVLKHNACSAALMLFDETRADLVRPGISLYGYYPSRETIVSLKNRGYEKKSGLIPVLKWITKPLQIKDVKAGSYIGYGLTYRATRDMKIAVLPVGYSDGYDRKLSNRGYVLIKGKRCPVVGRVCMNLFMVDVSDVEGVSVNDEVVLLGRSGEEEITADTMASLIGSINYEVLARLNPFIQRVIIAK